MDDVWFGPGLTRGDFDACLRALALDAKSEPPLLAVAIGEGERATLVLASRALFDLFEVATSEALADRLLGGTDPGAQRLDTLLRTLPLEGAPRLERLRFSLGSAGEVITFLCRRLKMASGQLVLVAAALGVRARLAGARPAETPAREPAPASATAAVAPPPKVAEAQLAMPFAAATPADAASNIAPKDEASEPLAESAESMRALRARLPPSRTLRFLWQTDAQAVITLVTPPLESAVGHGNADIVGRSFSDLAPRIDPSGRLAEAIAGRGTWSGLEVHWPISDAAGAVAVTLGAIPAFDRDRAFEGYRGYGVVYPDRIVARAPTRLTPAPEPAQPAGQPSGNVVRFPGARFSAEDQIAFDELGAKLRDHAGLNEPPPVVPEPKLESKPEPKPEPAQPAAEPLAAAAPEPSAAKPPADKPPADKHPVVDPPRAKEIGRNGLAVLDRLALGLLISRDNVPILANRHLLDLLGFADEDALHEAGGLAHLFGGQPGNVTGSEAVGVRTRDGSILRTNARMQRIDWDGLPATLLTLQAGPHGDAAHDADHDAAIETMARDHREARRADESELRELRAILETATDGVAVIDPAGDILSLNRSGEALLGCDRGQVIGKPFLDLFAPENRDLAEGYLADLDSGSTRSLFNDGRELRLKAPQGGTIPVFMTLGRLDPGEPAIEGGKAMGARLCALFRDLTHWKKVEGELETAKQDAERASALKSDFLAKVSHEVRTPLNAIIGFAEVILEERFGPVGNERYKDYLRDIHASGTHVMSLVNDLLDLSKIEAGKMELDVVAIDANKIIGECVGLMQPMASRERVIMRQSLASGLPMIKADERSLRQILLNLLSNAIKFNEPGGQVIVATAAPEDGKVVIRIRDTGPGMSDEDIAAALEPFRQVASRQVGSRQAASHQADSSGRPASGTGLGLPLTKALVEANEAAFTIRSKVAQGTLVEVAFPSARVLAG